MADWEMTIKEDPEPLRFGRSQEEILQEIADNDPDKGLTCEILEYYEYECGSYCAGSEERGCPGHMTDIPISIEINGVEFRVGDDFPSSKEETQHVVKVINALREHCNKGK